MNDVDATKFSTNLPIQLDASCNGYQHISLLTRQEKVFKHLNLKPSTTADKPEDFYNYILFQVNDYINKKLKNNHFDKENPEEKESFKRLQKINLSRSMVKKALMTYSYNASHPQMVNYVKQALHSFTMKIGDKEEIVYSNSETSKCYLTSKDISIFVKCFTDVIKETFPKMHELKNYIKSIVKICTKLNIPIPWVLPSGAIVSQSYLDSKTLKIRPFAFINSRFSFKTIIKDKFDLRKQSNAAMPNLIHSLDASSIALLYKELSGNNTLNLYTIHDCFAVTADRVELLINLLKGVYLKIYSDDIYLLTLDKHIKYTILNSFGPTIFSQDQKYIILDNKEKIAYPKLDKVIDTKICIKSLKQSSLKLNLFEYKPSRI
jgi:DNA-directed RNA polymerase